jgi:hypothetical protein
MRSSERLVWCPLAAPFSSQIPSCGEGSGVKSGALGSNRETGLEVGRNGQAKSWLHCGYKTCLGPSASGEAEKFAAAHHPARLTAQDN